MKTRGSHERFHGGTSAWKTLFVCPRFGFDASRPSSGLGEAGVTDGSIHPAKRLLRGSDGPNVMALRRAFGEWSCPEQFDRKAGNRNT